MFATLLSSTRLLLAACSLLVVLLEEEKARTRRRRRRRRCDVVGRRIPFRHFRPRLRQVMQELATLASRNQPTNGVGGLLALPS